MTDEKEWKEEEKLETEGQEDDVMRWERHQRFENREGKKCLPFDETLISKILHPLL